MWDYARNNYVHPLTQPKYYGKLVELNANAVRKQYDKGIEYRF